MADRIIPADQFADELMEALTDYHEEITEKVKAAADVVAPEVDEEIRKHVTFGGKKYVKAFRLKVTAEGKWNKQVTWYVNGPYYRLTHLLEHGHQTTNGGRTKAYPHIIYGERLAEIRMQELAEEAVAGDK
jgi:hypothetical protein